MSEGEQGRKASTYRISEAEAGMRLLRFLERRLGLPRPLLFRLLRSGQIRVNKGRAKADRRLCAGDEVRLPPQAASGNNPIPAETSGAFKRSARTAAEPDFLEADFGPGLRLFHADRHYLVLEKLAGLPVQPGSGHADSVSARLRKLAAAMKERVRLGGEAEDLGEFVPAPAHRIDKQSSGLILAGRTHLGQRYLHSLFAGEGENPAVKTDGETAKLRLRRQYLVWVSGIWEFPGTVTFRDRLFQAAGADGRERMFVAGDRTAPGLPEAERDKACLAVAEFSLLKSLPTSPCGPASLLRVLLHSGRKHQIRVQCAFRGHPVIGDRRYGGPRFSQMLLHAYSITVPACENFLGASFAEAKYKVFPEWPAPFRLDFGEEVFFACGEQKINNFLV